VPRCPPTPQASSAGAPRTPLAATRRPRASSYRASASSRRRVP